MGVYWTNSKSVYHRHTYTSVFIAVRAQNQPRYLSMEWVKNCILL